MGKGKTWLDTKYFQEAEKAFSKGVDEYDDIKDKIESITKDLLANWKGDGRKQFEKDYKIIYQQLKDIGDILSDLSESISDSEEKYNESDESLGKSFQV